MQITIRLYAPYDRDLMALKNYYGKRFQSILTRSLRQVFTGADYSFEVPKNLENYNDVTRHSMRLVVSLDNYRDKETIKWIKALRPRTRNTCIKNLLRYCYDRYPFSMFVMTDREKALEKNDVKTGEEEVQAKKPAGMPAEETPQEHEKEEKAAAAKPAGDPAQLSEEETNTVDDLIGGLIGG